MKNAIDYLVGALIGFALLFAFDHHIAVAVAQETTTVPLTQCPPCPCECPPVLLPEPPPQAQQAVQDALEAIKAVEQKEAELKSKE